MSFKDGWFNTNDYGVMTSDNLLHIYCRTKDLPRCNGKLIIPNTVEENLNKHSFVILGLMIRVPGNSKDNEKIAIYVKLVDGFDETKAKQILLMSLEEVIDLNIIAKFTFVDHIRRTATGKVDRELLKKEYSL